METVCHTASGEGGQLCKEQTVSMNAQLHSLSLPSPICWLLHQKLEPQKSPLETWAVMATLWMAGLDTVPLDRGRQTLRVHDQGQCQLRGPGPWEPETEEVTIVLPPNPHTTASRISRSSKTCSQHQGTPKLTCHHMACQSSLLTCGRAEPERSNDRQSPVLPSKRVSQSV